MPEIRDRDPVLQGEDHHGGIARDVRPRLTDVDEDFAERVVGVGRAFLVSVLVIRARPRAAPGAVPPAARKIQSPRRRRPPNFRRCRHRRRRWLLFPSRRGRHSPSTILIGTLRSINRASRSVGCIAILNVPKPGERNIAEVQVECPRSRRRRYGAPFSHEGG